MQLSTFEAFKHLSAQNSNYFYLKDDELKKYQAYLLSMMTDIISVCEKENVTYTLGGGTALGAVRHKGFIPWDDDADINVLGADYQRFRSSFLKEYGNKYEICDDQTPGFCEPSVRVCLKGTKYVKNIAGDVGNMFCVDVILMESTPDNKLLRNIHGFFCMAAGFLFSCRCFFKNRKVRIAFAKGNTELLKVVYLKIAIGAPLAIVSADTWTKWLWKCYGSWKNNKSKYVSFPSGSKHYFGELYLRAGIADTVKMPFEGHNWCVPKDYDGYLKALYGPDYMTPPPETQRGYHYIREIEFPKE